MLVGEGYVLMSAYVHRYQRHHISLQLDLQAVVSHPSWILGMEFRSLKE